MELSCSSTGCRQIEPPWLITQWIGSSCSLHLRPMDVTLHLVDRQQQGHSRLCHARNFDAWQAFFLLQLEGCERVETRPRVEFTTVHESATVVDDLHHTMQL